MVLSGRENFLIEAIHGETDLALTMRICNELGIDSSGASLVRPSEPFNRPMYFQHFLSDIVFLLETPLVDDELVVFVDARPVLQTFSAVRLAHPVIPVGEAMGLFNIQVEAVEGYRLWLKGGRRQRDSLVAEHRDTFCIKLEPQEFEYTSSDSQDETSGGDGDDGDGDSDASSSGTSEEEVAAGSASVAVGVSHPETGEAPLTGDIVSNRSASGGEWGQGRQETSKWNYAFDQEAFAQGRHGDTSGCVYVGCSPSATTSASLTGVAASGRAPLASRLTRNSYRLGEAAWSILAILLVVHVVPSDAAVLPVTSENAGGSGQDTQVPDHHFEGHGIYREPASTTCSPSRWFLPFAEPSGDSRFGPGDFFEDCCTLLDGAKGHEFYRTCRELAWFVEHSTLQASSEIQADCPGVVISLEQLLTQYHVQDGSSKQGGTADGPVRQLLSASQAAHSALWDTGVSTSFCADLCRPWLALSSELPDTAYIHENALAALSLLPDEPGPCDHVSIFTDGSFDGTSSSWSAVFLFLSQGLVQQWAWLGGVVSVDPQAHCWCGALEHSALAGEKSAIVWASLWALQTCIRADISLHVDSLSALHGCTGLWAMDFSEPLSRVLRGLIQALTSLDRLHAGSSEHVQAHAGHPFNELADSLAKHCLACGMASPMPPWRIIPDGTGSVYDHLWLSFERHHRGSTLPCFTEATFASIGLGEFPDLTKAAAWTGAWSGKRRHGTPGQVLGLRLVTANVQTLDDPVGAEFAGRAAYIRDQLEWHEVTIVAIQEARSKHSATFVSSNFVRLCSGCTEGGHLGVELWFSRIASRTADGLARPVFQLSDLVVLYNDPRTIIVRACNDSFRAVIVAIHAPTQQDPDRDMWWAGLLRRMRSFADGWQIFILGDFNARLDAAELPHVGDLVWKEPHGAPASLRKIWSEFDVWLPSTFSGCHCGESCTWFPPGGGRPSRIDYIAVPLDTWVVEGGSYLLASVDLGQKSLDHIAVCLDVFFTSCGSGKAASRPVFSYDRETMRLGDNVGVLRTICSSAPQVEWEVDVHTHYERLATHFRNQLVTAFPQKKRGRAGSFLSDHTWSIRARRLWLRGQAYLHRRRAALYDVIAALKAWQWKQSLARARPVCAFLIAAQEFRVGGIVEALRETHKLLRSSVRADKAALIRSAAEVAARGGPKDVMQRLGPLLGPPKRLRRDRAPLPGVKLVDGRIAPTGQANVDRWVEHFASIEGGSRLSREHLAAFCVARQFDRRPAHYELGPGDLPSLAQVEAAVRDTAVAKAMGSDFIPGELAHGAPAELSRVLYPLLLKIWLRNTEPLQFKGGVQHAVWKRKGPQDQCDSFRAILVTSVIGKINHALLRRACIDAMAQSGSTLQIGGLPRYPVTYGSQVVRLYQAAATNNNYALVFLDLKEAFYRVIRPLLVPGLDELAHVQAVVDRLCLPAWAACDIVALWKRPAIVRTTMTPHQRSLWTENFSDAWFKVPGQQDIVRTSTGSRPGDSLADAGFYFLFSWVLNAVTTTLKHEGWLQPVPWDESMVDNFFPVASPCSSCWPSDVTWMDDLCLLLRFDSPQLCVRGTSFAAGLLVDVCLRHGMEPNLGPGKTECILQLRGQGSRALRRDVHSRTPPSLPLGSLLRDKERIRVVAQYKHLGGLVFHAGGLLQEARSRVGQAWSSFRRRSKQVYASSGVNLGDKCQIFMSVVESTLLYGVGTWPVITDKVTKVLESGYVDMVRRILHRSCSWDTFRAGPQRILAAAGLPNMETQLRVHRLRFLSSFVQLGVHECWALAHQQCGWLSLVRSSLFWLWQHIHGQQDSLAWTDCIASWVAMIKESPHKWKALVKRACSAAIWEARLADLHQQFLGLAAKQLLFKGATIASQRALAAKHQEAHLEACGICGKAFKDKRAWAVHAFKCHGRVRDSRRIVSGESCPACLRVYASHIRLCNHLHHSTICAQQLRLAGFQTAVQPGVNSRKANRGRPAFGPVLQAQGPQPRTHEDDGGPAIPVVEQLLAAFRDLRGHRDVCKLDQLLAFYRQVLLAFCASRDDVTKAFEYVQRELRSDASEDIPVSHLFLHARAVTWMQENFSTSWLLDGEPEPLVRSFCSFRDSTAIWEAMDFTSLSGNQTPELDGGFAYGIVLEELLPWARNALPKSHILGAASGEAGRFADCWESYKSAVGDNTNMVPLYINFSTKSFSDILSSRPSTHRQWKVLWEAQQLLFDAALIFVAARLLGQPVVFVLPQIVRPMVWCLDRIPGVICHVSGALLMSYGVEPSSFPQLCFTV